jgi:hypothetical protein
MTKPRRKISAVEPMPRAAWRWLLGQRSRWDANGHLVRGAIPRWLYLDVKVGPQNWEKFLAGLWSEHKAEVQAWHKRRFPRWRAPRSAAEMEASYQRRMGLPPEDVQES